MKFIKFVKKHKILWLSLICWGLAGLTSFQVLAYQDAPIVDPKPLSSSYPIRDDTAPVLVSLAALYSPMETEESWSDMVCAGMTEGGCNYFKVMQADKVWQGQLGNAASTANFVASIRNIDEDHQLWQAQITVFSKRSYDRHAKGSTSDVYLLVQRGDDQKWYLDRVLVGPGIER